MNQLNERGSVSRGASKRIGAVLVVVCVLQLGASARAQESAAAVAVTVLRSNGADTSAVADPVDAALLRDLANIAGLDNAQFSPIEYEEIQLTVGCGDQSRGCLAAIAGVAQVNGLVLRSLAKSGAAMKLDLVYFDASSRDEPARASFTGEPAELVGAVPSLVRSLFGIPEVAAPIAAGSSAEVTTATSPVTVESDGGGVNTLTIASIVTLAAGVGVGLAGIVVGMSASSTFDDYKNTAVTDQASARRASNAFSDAESKATVANILMPVGGALVVGGVIMLVLGLSAESEPAPTAQVVVAPVQQGAMLMVSGLM